MIAVGMETTKPQTESPRGEREVDREACRGCPIVELYILNKLVVKE